MNRLFLIFLAIIGGQVGFSAEWKPLSEEDRTAVDRRVLAQPDLRTEEPKQAFYGTLAGFGVSRTPMKAEEELELARKEHKQILKSFDTSPAPPLAAGVLNRLTKHLPGAAPGEFEYSLTIIEIPAFRSWTVGGGFLYLSRPIYEALTQTQDHAEDRLAFVLAHEMGHVVRKHCRRGYQLLKLKSFAEREGLAEDEISKLRKAVRKVVTKTGDRLRFLYDPVEEFQADLFAAHLCRNAGFDRDAGWDVLRWGVLTEERGGDFSADPAYALISNDNLTGEKNRPSADDRLRQMCCERDGVISGSEFGLWEFDPKAEAWIKCEELRIGANERVIVLVHGMDSQLSKCYTNLAKELAGDPDFRGQRILGFQYPGDASLARVGEFLYREISLAIDPKVRPVFVGHSAGGLVARYYAEVKQGPFERIILQGTPNQGSDFAKLRPVVETKQFAKDLKDGYSQAVENAILDGQGQIAHDLQPGSLFLNHLNNRRPDRSRYAILRGRRYSMAAGQATVLGRWLLKRKIERSDAPKILRERAVRSLEKIELPEEVRRGDLLVSTQSAELEGVSIVQTFKLRHGKLPKDEKTIAAVLEILRADLKR